MKVKFYRWLLKIAVNNLYRDNSDGGLKGRRKRLLDDINGETWVGAHIDTGGHLLAHLDPMVDYELVSVINAMTGETAFDCKGCVTTDVNYYKKEWKG